MESSIAAVWVNAPEVQVSTKVCVPVAAVPLPAIVAVVDPGGVIGLSAIVVVKPGTEDALKVTRSAYSLIEVRLTVAALLSSLQVLMVVGSALMRKSGYFGPIVMTRLGSPNM